MSDSSARLSSMAVLGGPLHGKTLQLSESPEEITIGSDPSCRFHLDTPGVSALHARIVADETGAAVFDSPGSRGLFLNFEKVEGRAALSDGDMLRLGPPQERDSVMIQLEFGGALLESEPAIFDSTETPAAATAAPPIAAPAPEEPAFVLDDTTAPAPGPVHDPDAAFIAELSSADDDAFVITDEHDMPTTPPAATELAPEAEPAPEFVEPPLDFTEPPPDVTEPPPDLAEPKAVVEDAPVVADEFFLASEIEAAPPARVPDVPAPYAPEPPPASAAPTSSVAFEMPAEGDFALPGFDPNWSAPPAAPAGDGFFADIPKPAAVDDGFALPPLEAAGSQAPAPAAGFGLDSDAQPLMFDDPLPAPAPKPAVAAAPPPTPPAPAPRPPAPAAAPPVAARPRPEAAASEAPARPRPPRRPPEEGAAPPSSRAPRPTAAARGRSAPPSPLGRYAALGGGGLVALGLIAFVATRLLGGGAKIAAVEPSRVKVGQTISVSGGPFAADPSANEVLFGDKPGSVLEAESNRLKVQVPDLALTPGKDVTIALRVRVAGKESRAFDLTVFGGPTVVGISPDVAMPGEEVVLSGSGWGAAPTVHFGDVAAEVLQVAPASIRVRVPNLAGGPGTAAAAVVKDGPAESNPAPFFLGRIPLLTKVEPASAVPGDLVTLTGRGFRREPNQNTVTIGGARALVTVAVDSELHVVAPFNAIGASGGLELRVPGSEHAAQAPASVMPSSDTVDFRFAAQPFDAVPGRDHAVLWTGIGPAFVVAASSGKTA
ncbi:MAG TPA: IPT/TIG domain-containing protein, partial [Vicinamibacteria bacterium]|nr:IPT/TIG domain-containing protein [Vicinamibacteria bacterium]